MPPKMSRQNAFFQELEISKDVPIACRICYESEVCGEWKRITCQCSILHDYYHAHEYCLQRSKRCKVCSSLFIIQKTPTFKDKIHAVLKPHCQKARDVLYKYGSKMAILVVVSLCIWIIYDIIRCTTIEEIDENDLPDLKNDSIWLPVSLL